MPVQHAGQHHLPHLSVPEGRDEEGNRDRDAADDHGDLGADLANHNARDDAEDDHGNNGRQQEQAGLGDGLSEPVAKLSGELQQRRDQDERAEHRETKR